MYSYLTRYLSKISDAFNIMISLQIELLCEKDTELRTLKREARILWHNNKSLPDNFRVRDTVCASNP